MTYDDYKVLESNLQYRYMLIQQYADKDSDIAISPNVLDGMPFQHTNDTSDPTEQKAMSLVLISGAIKYITKDINEQFAKFDRKDIKQIMILKYGCGYTWTEVGEIMGDKNVKKKYFNFIHLF